MMCGDYSQSDHRVTTDSHQVGPLSVGRIRARMPHGHCDDRQRTAERRTAGCLVHKNLDKRPCVGR